MEYGLTRDIFVVGQRLSVIGSVIHLSATFYTGRWNEGFTEI
jgi:hypothetical protein